MKGRRGREEEGKEEEGEAVEEVQDAYSQWLQKQEYHCIPTVQ